MKKIAVFLLIIFPFFFMARETESIYKQIVEQDVLEVIRKGYYRAVDYPDSAEMLLKLIEEHYGRENKKYSPIIKSYYACLKGLKGKFSSNLYVKYEYVAGGVKMINGAVDEFPDCLEMRFLRFSFFYYLPKIFDIEKKRNEDLIYLIEKFKERDYSFVPESLQRDMIEFTIQTGLLNKDDYNSFLEIIIEIMKREIDGQKKSG